MADEPSMGREASWCKAEVAQGADGVREGRRVLSQPLMGLEPSRHAA